MRKVLPWLITIVSCFLVTGALAAVKYQQITAAIAFGASFPSLMKSSMRNRSVQRRIHRSAVWAAQSADLNLLKLARGWRSYRCAPHRSGAVVKKGQPLLELFSADLTAQQKH